MKIPVAKYNMVDNSVDYQHVNNVVWAAILDKRYKIEVVRLENYKGQFTMYDSHSNDEVICDEPTTLSYGAKFGPDAADLARWERRAMAIADGF